MENQPKATWISRHALLMVVCCAVPLMLIAAVGVLRIDVGGLGSWAILLLCPLLHLVLMRGMHSQGTGQSCHTTSAQQITQQAEPVSLTIPDERAKVPASVER